MQPAFPLAMLLMMCTDDVAMPSGADSKTAALYIGREFCMPPTDSETSLSCMCCDIQIYIAVCLLSGFQLL